MALAALSLLSALAMPHELPARLVASEPALSDSVMTTFFEESIAPEFEKKRMMVREETWISKGGWNLNPAQFENSMSMFVYATLNGNPVPDDAVLAAFTGGGAKGEMITGLKSPLARKFPFGKYANKNIFALMVYGPEDVDASCPKYVEMGYKCPMLGTWQCGKCSKTCKSSCPYTYKLSVGGKVYPVKSINKDVGDPTVFKTDAHYGNLVTGVVEMEF